MELIWKDISFLQDIYKGYQLSNNLNVRKKCIDGSYYYFDKYKKGKSWYIDLRFKSKYGDVSVPINLNKLYTYLFKSHNKRKRLKLETIEKIREEYKSGIMSQTDLSRKYMVSTSTINSIVLYKTYKNL